MRSDGAGPGPGARLCGALSLVLGALLGGVIGGRGAPDAGPSSSSPPPYLPVSFRVLGADTAFLLRGAPPDPPGPPPNASLQARVESFLTHRARRPPRLSASLGPFSVEEPLPLASAPALTPTLAPGGPPGAPPLGWRLRAHVLRDQLDPGRPVAQVLFQVLGRDWAEPGPAEPPPCLRAYAFREAREVRAGCRPRGALGLCVAELRLPPGWFAPAAGAAGGAGGRRPAGPAEGSPVELYYAVHAGGRGDCNAARAPGKGGPEGAEAPLRSAGTVRLRPAPDRGRRLRELRLDGAVAVWLPSAPARPGAVVTAYVTVAANSSVDRFTLRARVKKGVAVLSAQPSEPGQWAVRQEPAGSKHSTGTSAVVCQRLAPANRSSSAGAREVAQLSLAVGAVSGLAGSQPVAWQLEYPGAGAAGSAVSQIFVSQRDLVGIVPLATDTELLNTAVLTGQAVALPLRAVAVEESGAITDVSEAVECRAADEAVLKVSARCDYVYVNGKEVRGRVDAEVTFAYQHLRAALRLTVWAPRLPLHIEVSDAELSQIKGWRVPVVDSKRPAPAGASAEEPEEEDAEAARRGGRGCALQYQRATVRVLTRFLAEGAGPWAQPRLLLGPGWQVDVTGLVAASMTLEAPRVAALLGGRVLVGLEAGMTTIQVLSPLSDSILAEKTVTVTEDRVSLAGLAVQLVAGLSVSLHPSAENPRVVTAVARAEELLRAPKQEAVVSTWLRFSDGSVAPLEIYDSRDFALSAASLDEAVVSVPPARAPAWPVVAAEGEGEGPLVRVELSTAGTCHKSRRRSVLASGVGSVRVQFGPKDAEKGAEAAAAAQEEEEEEEGQEGEPRNRASDRRPQGAEGAARGGGPTATPPLDPRAAWHSRTDGARPPAEGQAEAGASPLDPSLPAQAAAAGAGPGGGGPAPGAARGLGDLEIGMYALLGAFCLAILVFLANCAAFALRFRRKRLPPEGAAAASSGGAHSHDWVWLGNEAELLGGAGRGSPPPPTREDPGRLLLAAGGSPRQAQGQAPRPAAHPAGRPGRDPRRERPPSPAPGGTRKVQFYSFPGGVSPETSSPSVPSGPEDAPWVCPARGVGAPRPLRTRLDQLRDAV